jgi:hypothetical protein
VGGLVASSGLGVTVCASVVGLASALDVVVDALHALFEAAETFTEALAELGQLLAAEEKNGESRQDDEVPRLK